MAKKRKRRRWPYVVLALLAVPLLVAWYLWPDVDAVVSGPLYTSAFMELTPRPRHAWLPYSEIDDDAKVAVIASEDTRFFKHRGFDTHEIKEALKDRLFDGDNLRGASTITQQVAKNLWLSPKRSFFRKLIEAALAWQLERAATKQRILEIYLNVAEFGPGTYGVEAASMKYFGHSAAELSVNEAAQLAAGLPRGAWRPGVDNEGYKRAIARLERRMANMTWVRDLI